MIDDTLVIARKPGRREIDPRIRVDGVIALEIQRQEDRDWPLRRGRPVDQDANRPERRTRRSERALAAYRQTAKRTGRIVDDRTAERLRRRRRVPVHLPR